MHYRMLEKAYFYIIPGFPGQIEVQRGFCMFRGKEALFLKNQPFWAFLNKFNIFLAILIKNNTF